jgi:hypothetical protein
MASTTTNLGLMKPAYSDDADISDINGNMDLIDAEAGRVRANVAANYDSSETYAVGDYCLHDGSLYKCSTAISSPEAWTAGHWTQIKITGELSALNGKTEILYCTVSATGITFQPNDTYLIKIGHLVIMQLAFKPDTNVSAWTTFFTIPEGFKPIKTVFAQDLYSVTTDRHYEIARTSGEMQASFQMDAHTQRRTSSIVWYV